MNSENAKDYLPLVQALADGRVIQVNVTYGSAPEKWIDSEDIEFYHPASSYRIKPEPREIWVNEYSSGANIMWDTEGKARRKIAAGAVTRHYREVIE